MLLFVYLARYIIPGLEHELIHKLAKSAILTFNKPKMGIFDSIDFYTRDAQHGGGAFSTTSSTSRLFN